MKRLILFAALAAGCSGAGPDRLASVKSDYNIPMSHGELKSFQAMTQDGHGVLSCNCDGQQVASMPIAELCGETKRPPVPIEFTQCGPTPYAFMRTDDGPEKGRLYRCDENGQWRFVDTMTEKYTGVWICSSK